MVKSFWVLVINMKLKGLLLMLLLSVSLMLSMFSFNSRTAGDAPTQLSILPKSIVNISITAGSTFTINCSVVDVSNLFTWQVKVYFNPAVLNCTDVYYPSDHIFAGKMFLPVTPVIDNDEGFFLFGCSLMGAETPFSGSGTLCQANFKVKAVGESYLNYSEPYGEDTFLLDSNLDIIFVEVTNGYFSNAPPPPPKQFSLTITTTIGGTTDPPPGTYTYDEGTVVSVLAIPNSGYKFENWVVDGVNSTLNPIEIIMDRNYTLLAVFSAVAPPPPPAATTISLVPKEIVDPTLVPSSVFSINISVAGAETLSLCMLNLSYNTGILSWISVEALKIQNVTPSVNAVLNDDEGYLWLSVDYPVPVEAIESTAILTVSFHVEDFGATVLDLHDTELLDAEGNPVSHEAIDGYFCSLIRDVAVSSVVVSRDWAYSGWEVNITVTVENLGNVSETFDVSVYYDDSFVGSASVIDLQPGAEANVIVTWNTTGVSQGNYTIKAEASEVPYEYNVTNNVLVDGSVWIMELRHDVAVTEISVSRDWIYEGWSVSVNFTIGNLGNYSETFDVRLFLLVFNETEGSWYNVSVLCSVHVTDLPPNEQMVFNYTLDSSGLKPCLHYKFMAEASEVPYEYNVTNNVLVGGEFVVRLMGDVNGDGKVCMLDIAIAQEAFGSYPGHPKWNPDADVNCDLTVNLRDIALIARNFGRSC